MSYKFNLNLDEYESYLKIVFRLLKGNNSILDWRVKIWVVVVYICLNILISILNIKLLLNISIILGAIVVILVFAISSKKVLFKNVKLIARIYSKKYHKPIYDERIVSIKKDEVIYTIGESSCTTKLYNIKEVITDENIIALVSNFDKICAVISNRVFNDEKEKEEFLQIINEKRCEKPQIEEDMDYTYEISVKDYANYLFVNGANVNKKINKGMNIFIFVFGIIYSVYFTYIAGLIAGAIFMIGTIIIYLVCFCVSTTKNFEKRTIRESKKYLKKHPELLNTQSIKLEEADIIHCINGMNRKLNIKSITKLHLKNDTIVVFGPYNQLYFILPCNVFSSESERDSFIGLLSKG